MTEQRVNVEIIDNIAHVKLNRADKLNALDMAMFLAIRSAIKALQKNRNIRAVIVSGNGDDFCSGLDVKSIMKSSSSMVKLLFKALPWRGELGPNSFHRLARYSRPRYLRHSWSMLGWWLTNSPRR